MQIRLVTPDDAQHVGQTLYNAFCGIADRHNFPHDVPSLEAAMQLAQMCIQSPNMTGFVAQGENDEFLGSNFLWRQNSIYGVGPITVAPEAQTKGIGRALMKAVIEAGKDAAGIRLVQDAFNTTSLSLYASLGFEVVEPLVLIEGRPVEATRTEETDGAGAIQIRPCQADDYDECGALCQIVHGFDRNVELRQTAEIFPAFVAVRQGRITAYGAALNFWQLNHAVAETTEDMQALLLGASHETGQPLSFLLPMRQAPLFRWCLSHKLRVVKPMTLMAMGSYQEPRGCYLPSVIY